MKWILLMAAALWLVAIHRENRKIRSLTWPDYGKQLLGLGPEKENRKKYLDRLRFLAAILVILVHSMQSAAAKLQEAGEMGVMWHILTGAAGLGLCCNLLFVMISGALLIPCREESIGVFYRKRFTQVVVPLAAYYFFYLHRSGLLRFTLPSIVQAAKTVIAGPMELVPHFWLIYVLIRLSIPVPLLRLMEKSLTDSARRQIAFLVLLGITAKTILYFLGTGFGFDSVWFSWEGIFLMGYVLSADKSRKQDKLVFAAGLAAAPVIAWIHCTRTDGRVIAANDSALMLLFSMAVFLLFLRQDEKQGRRRQGKKEGETMLRAAAQMLIRPVSRYSYSILLIHWFMLFVVVEKHLHIHPMMFGQALVLGAVLFQSAMALLLSLVFAVIYDNTAVLLAERCSGLLLRPSQAKR